MFKKYIALCSLAAAAQAQDQNELLKDFTADEDKSNHWAVLVAGSKTYSNYRHQADTCHAYQILIKNGIPAHQIIHIAQDDIANNRTNPFKGKIYNKGGSDPIEVYEGCKIDYTGSDANKNVLMAVLTGDYDTAAGPVLMTDSDSKIFFYFADHGAPGLVAMPNGKYFYAKDLHKTLLTMNEKKMYKEMALYVEACESGSMFEKILEDNLNIYAVSAANSSESSWAAYCGAPDNVVDGQSIYSCLGDAFSVSWMEDSDKADFSKETFNDQYNKVKSEVDKSHVLQWGQLSLASEPLADFQSGHDVEQNLTGWQAFKNIGKYALGEFSKYNQLKAQRLSATSVDSRDAKLHYHYNQMTNDPSPETYQAFTDEMNHRQKVDTFFQNVFPQHMEAVKNKTTPRPITDADFECYEQLIDAYNYHCGQASDYSFKYFGSFVAECSHLQFYPEMTETVSNKMREQCLEN